jgi:hypothetical protein
MYMGYCWAAVGLGRADMPALKWDTNSFTTSLEHFEYKIVIHLVHKFSQH